MAIIRILILTLLLLLLVPFAEGGVSPVFHDTSKLKIIIAYDQNYETKIKESLKASFPGYEGFFNKHRIINIMIEGSDEFCANEFLVTDGRNDGIEVVLMLFTAHNEWIADYCHKVTGYTWGLLFVPLGKSNLNFNFRNINGAMDIGVEYPI